MRSGRLFRTLPGIIVLLSGLAASSVAWAQGSDVVLETDIVYVTRGETKLLLDIARPAKQAGPSPAVIFLHGWGPYVDKEFNRGEIMLAAKRGYVGVAASYRIPYWGGEETRFPAQVHDVKAAVRWLRANAERYAVDPDAIGVVGFSMGGYLALMLAFTGPSDGFEGEILWPGVSSKVQAVVAAGAPVDWAYLARGTDVTPDSLPARIKGHLFGAAPEDIPDLYRASDPREYIGPRDAPVLAIYGGWDLIVPPREGRILEEAMMSSGANHSFLMIPRAMHILAELVSPDFDYPMWSFLSRYLKGK
jgi:acetyl esterase/lipase